MRATAVLAAMTAFIGVGAAIGSTLIVPSLPIVLYRAGFLSNDFVPAVGLGIVAEISIAAAFAVVTHRRVGPFLGVAAGISLIEFKLVEAFAVGNLLFPRIDLGVMGYALAWLQPPLIALGVAMIVLAVRARQVERR